MGGVLITIEMLLGPCGRRPAKPLESIDFPWPPAFGPELRLAFPGQVADRRLAQELRSRKTRPSELRTRTSSFQRFSGGLPFFPDRVSILCADFPRRRATAFDSGSQNPRPRLPAPRTSRYGRARRACPWRFLPSRTPISNNRAAAARHNVRH